MENLIIIAELVGEDVTLGLFGIGSLGMIYCEDCLSVSRCTVKSGYSAESEGGLGSYCFCVCGKSCTCEVCSGTLVSLNHSSCLCLHEIDFVILVHFTGDSEQLLEGGVLNGLGRAANDIIKYGICTVS